LSRKKTTVLLDRLYRILLILAAALIGGLLLYAVTPNLTPRFGEDVAALWSWFLIFLTGFAAQRLLPKDDLSRVSHILLAILASSLAAMLSTWAFIVLLDAPFDEGGVPQLLMVGAAALAFATIVFCPIYWLRRKTGRYQAGAYVLSGVLMPAAWIFIARPFGNDGFKWIAYEAAVFAAIGASAALAFMMVAGRAKAENVETR
jgi:hypothetical protein